MYTLSPHKYYKKNKTRKVFENSETVNIMSYLKEIELFNMKPIIEFSMQIKIIKATYKQ